MADDQTRLMQETHDVLEAAGDDLSKKFHAGSVFAIFVWDPTTDLTHLWVPSTHNPVQVKEIIRAAFQAIDDPERVIGGD